MQFTITKDTYHQNFMKTFSINPQAIKDHIIFNKKSHRFEFRVFPKSKSKLDVDYYPLITPRSIHDITPEIIKVFINLVSRELNRISEENITAKESIYLDELCNTPAKTYRLFNTKGKPINIIRSSATGDLLEAVILIWSPRARTYQEV